MSLLPSLKYDCSFLVRTISISDTLALSVETRGFDLKSKPKEIYEPVIPKLYDWIYITSLILVSGAIIEVGIWLKRYRISTYLFQYADGNTKVLKDVNFSIPFGSVTLLTGRTGVGKRLF